MAGEAPQPIQAQSADGMIHQFPAGTDPTVIDGVMKKYAEDNAPPKPAEPAEPVSGTLKGMGKAAGQEAITSVGQTVSGVGAVTKMVGGAERQETNTDLDLMNRLDAGEDFGALSKSAPTNLARLALREYQVANPEQRQQIKQRAINTAAAPEGQVELTGEHIQKAGEKLGDYAKAAIPLTPEEESRSTVIGTKMVVGLTKYIGAALAGGMPAVVGIAGVDAFGDTYDKARLAGRTDAEATGDAMINGMVQGGLMTVPIGQATKVFDLVPVALKGEFVKALAEAGKSGLTLVGFSQVATIADNVVAKSTYDPTRKPLEGVGEHLPETFVAGALLPLAAAGMARVARGRTPAEVAKPVLDAPTVDDAIEKAKAVVSEPVDVNAMAQTAKTQGEQQGKLNQLFEGLNEGVVQKTDEGGFVYRPKGEEDPNAIPLKVWDEKAPAVAPAEGQAPTSTISPGLAAAQRDHYGKLGLDVVYFENDPGIKFDGAVDPQNPNTIFLSNNPERNAAQVGAHELTHVLESTTLPDGTNLGDLLHQQVARGVTTEGLEHAANTFGSTAPRREQFPPGAEGDRALGDAYVRHLVTELSADIGGEAPKFQTFIPRVVDEVQRRYGDDAAKGVMQKLIEGIRGAMQTVREFFVGERGPTETASQHWVANLDEIHGTLAKMYAERFGTQAERENVALAGMRDRAARERFIASNEGAKSNRAAGGEPVTEYEDARQKAATYKRWIGELERQGASDADVGRVRQAFFGERQRMVTARAAEPAEQVGTGPQRRLEAPAAVTPAPRGPVTPENVFRPETHGAPRGSAPTATSASFAHKLAHEVETVWADKSIMGKTQRGIARNEQFAIDTARERLMHEEAAPQIEQAIKEHGLPEDRIPAVAKFFRPAEGESMDEAFNKAVDRYMTIEEAKGSKATIDPDVATYDMLKAEGTSDPVLGEAFDRLDKHYAGENRGEIPGDEDIPFGTAETAPAQGAGKEAARGAAGRREGQEAGGKPGVGREAPAQEEARKPVEAKPAAEAPRPEPEREAPTRPKVIINRGEPHPVLPPAPEARPEPKPESPHAREAAPDHQFAERIAQEVRDADVNGRKMMAADLQKIAEQHYGGTLAEGKYTRDRFYDAIELGVNRFIQRHPERFSTVANVGEAMQTAKELARLKESLPTQTVRAGEKDAYQQFSTPPDYAYAAAWIAHLRPEDHVLEPSAGVGGLIVHAMTSGVRETTVNELSDKRRGMLAALEPSRITGEDAAQLHNILPAEVRPTVVIMNPPFSRAAERMGGKMVQDEGAKHIEQALQRLEPGGRLVAIVGDGMKPAGTVTEGYSRDRGAGGGRAFRDWWAKIGREYDVLANVGVDRDIYTKYGTSFPTRFLVIDKNPPSGRELVTGQVKDAAGLIEHLKEVRDERSEQNADQPDRTALVDRGEGVAGQQRELFGAARGLGTGEGPGERAAPAVAEPAGTPQPGERGGRAAGAGAEGGAVREPVVPVESEPADRGAGAEAAAPTGAGGESERGRADRGGDGVRPDGSGERVEPGVTPASEDVLATENAVTKPGAASEGVSEAIYENYKPQRIQITGAKAHPGALVQSAAMASVMPPKTDYKPRLPASLVKSGALSDAQLEAIVYAGHAHSDVMPNGKRRGFFIGDGTGVGKGREIAGILLDNKQNGRAKAVWVSEKRALLNDAKRDWNGLGQPATEILDHGKTKAGDDIDAKKGILFTTYDTLKSAEQTKAEGEKVRGRERVDQIVQWLGKDFDGVIAFDESHNLGNAVDTKGTRGVKKAAQKALAGVRLQEELPNARVVYVSATGATEVGNLAYADRLGLWGEGTPFPTRNDFVGKVGDGGMAAMELVARDMKALGHYIARSLSYDGVDYDRVEHTLSRDQRVTYDKLAEGWQSVLQNFSAALEMTGATQDGKTLNGKAKSAMLSAFWGGHQRFFNQVITAMQMPSVIKGVEADIKAKRQAVLQIVNTMEAAQERALDKARRSGEGDLEDLDMTPRDQLMQLVEKSFPVRQMEQYLDENQNLRSRYAEDSKGEPILNREAVAARDRLLDELGSIRVPDGPLEMLMNHFGVDQVAEVTGRGKRVVRKPDETGKLTTQVEKRGAQSNVADSNAFQEGKKPILIFSEAGGTGRSYHAAIGSGSEDARRSHYLVQGGWRADKAVQGFGRTHRTSQASPPIFHLVTTDLQGQKRFISSIARRLGQLGALTKGERRTGDQGMFGARDNLESAEARDGLIQFFRDVAAGKVEGVSMTDLETGMGLKMRDPETGGLASPLPEMSQFLNRVLSLKIDHQNRVFDAFSERMDQAIDRAAAAGTLDAGVETYKADKITKQSEQTVYTDQRSGAETQHVHLIAHSRNHPVDFDATLAGRNKTNGRKPEGFVQNNRSERVFAVTTAGDRTDEHGTVTSQVRLTSPVDYQMVDREKVGRDNFTKLSEEQARPLWDKQVAAVPEFRKSDLHLITGAVLPIWDRLGGSPKIYRLQTDQGERMLGRVIPSSLVDETLKRLGAEGLKVDAKPAEIAQRVLGGDTATLANDWKIKRSRVAGEDRLELVGPDFQHREELGRSGVFSERIQYNTRYFIPTEPAAAAKAIEGITKSRPVTSLSEAGAKFSPKLTGESNRQYTPEERATYERVGRAVEPTSLREKFNESTDDLGRKLILGGLDPYIGVKRNDPEGYMGARMANSAEGAKKTFEEYGPLKFQGSTYALKDRNGGAMKLVKDLGDTAHDFIWYVAANRAEKLKAEGRENLWSDQDIATVKATKNGTLDAPYTLSNGRTTLDRATAWDDALARYHEFNVNGLDMLRDSDMISREVYDKLKADPFYVPFFREEVDDIGRTFIGPASGLARQKAFERLKGGSEKLKTDLWRNAFDNWGHIIDASIKNRSSNQIADTTVRLGAAREVTAQEYDHQMTKAEKADTTWMMRDGKKRYVEFNDPMTLTAVSALQTVGKDGLFIRVAHFFSSMLRYGVTANPIFAVRNLTRDTENSLGTSHISPNPAKNLAQGFAMVDMGGRVKNLGRAMAGKELEALNLPIETVNALAGGALMRLGAFSDTGLHRTDVRNVLGTPGKLKAFGHYLAGVASAAKEVLAAGEDINRLALYKQTIEQGGAHDFASFSGRDLQDFTLRGANAHVQTLLKITPFLGSRLQGLYKLGRAASDADKNIAAAVGGRIARNIAIRAATVMGTMTLTGLALDAIYRDDEDYKKRTEYDRQTYYWFKIGDAQFRIPKGFELAALSSIATDGIEAFFDKEMTGARVAKNFYLSLGTNLQVQAPAVAQPILDLATNSRGTGGPIETAGMERLEPQARYTGGSTLLARGLSAAENAAARWGNLPDFLKVSPVQLDYLANAYGGWLATTIMGTADTLTRSFTSEPERPAKDFWASVTQGLVRTDTAPQSRYVDMLYEQGKQIEEAHNTYLNLLKLGRAAEAQAFFQDRKEELAKYGRFEGVKRLEASLNQQARMIENSATLTPEQKRVQIMRLNALKNRAAEQVFGANPR